MAKRTPDMLSTVLASSTPVTFEQLQAALGDASRATTFRYLRQVRHLRSYNHNGRFYTDRDPTLFDRYGLVSLGTVHFSRHGTLAATVQSLIRDSPAGWTQKELQSVLHVRVNAFLLAAVRQGTLQRERMDGVFLYHHCDPAVGDAQRRARQARLDERRAVEAAAALEPAVIIEVLLALIHHPGSSPAQVALRLQGHAPPIDLPQVTAVFTRFDLAEAGKKGGAAGS